MSHISRRFALAAVVALALSTVGVAGVGGGVARADTTTTTQTYTTPGVYTITVPQYTTLMTLDALGGAGYDGASSSGNVNAGGSAGSGTQVHGTSSVVQGGDVLQVVVGAMGGGAARGSGDGLAGGGGSGGGATYLRNLSNGNELMFVAGGGGGGGGGGAGEFGYVGGYGGTTGAGQPSTNITGNVAGKGGTYGVYGTCGGSGLSVGTPGESASTASAAGGGGGGGGGACGGGAGGSGDHGSGAGAGGGGGGSGASFASAGASATFTDGVNAGYVNGDGSASVSFTANVATFPQITSPASTEVPVGQNVFSFPVTASGFPAPTFSLAGATPDWLGIQSNGVLSGGPPPEASGPYPFTIIAENALGRGVQTFTLYVDHPLFFTSAPSAGATAGDRFSFAVTTGGYPAASSYRLSSDAPGWLSINPDTGQLSGTAPASDVGTKLFTVYASTSGSPEVSQPFSLMVNPARLTLTSTSLPAGTVGSPYHAILAATGGTSPYTWSLATGSSLPAGLVLHPDGTIDGTPTTTQTAPFTVQATDAATPAQTAIEELTLTINPAPVAVPGAPTVGTAIAGDGSASVTFTAPASDGGAPITGYTVTSAPGGRTAIGASSPLTVSGLGNGTAYTFTVTATNGVGTGLASAASNPVTPVAALAVTTPNPLPAGSVGTPYSATLTAAGGSSPYTWSLVAGSSLPAGLTLHRDGTLAGMPTAAGSRVVTVQVTDAATPGQTATKNLTVAVNPASPQADLAISLTHLSSFVTGHDGWYRVQITNTGTAATTRTTTVSTTLPGGLVPVWAIGSGWTCVRHGQAGSCSHTASLVGGASSTILLLVRITAPGGGVLNLTGTVAPTDTTPADNTSTDHVQVQRR